MKDVIVVTGSGSIAQSIARRVSVGKHILLADINLLRNSLTYPSLKVLKTVYMHIKFQSVGMPYG